MYRRTRSKKYKIEEIISLDASFNQLDSVDSVDSGLNQVDTSLVPLDSDMCLICLEPCEETNKLFKMKDFVLVDSSNCKCNGYFHIKCLLDWINVSKSCPICRSIITIDINLLKQMNLKYKYNNAIKQVKEHIKFFFNMCYGVLMIMTKYMILIYSVNIFISIMKALFELSLKKAQ